MKKIIVLFLSLIYLFYFLSSPVLAWLDCSYGRINDTYPGSCGWYIDTNNDNFCDHSEPPPKISKTNLNLKINNIVLPIFLTLAVYFIHWYLVFQTKLVKQCKLLNKSAWRYTWNVLLGLTFLLTAVSALLIVLDIKNSWLSFWHNEIGLIFIVIGLLHIIGRFVYFKTGTTSFIKS